MIFQTFLLFSGSSPELGSSKKTILGSPTILMAILNLRFIPPESYFTFLFPSNITDYIELLTNKIS